MADTPKQEKDFLGADAAAVETAGQEASSAAPHVALPRIWAVWCPFKKSGFPVLGTFGTTERKVVIVPMEVWNSLCAEIPALHAKQFEVGSYE